MSVNSRASSYLSWDHHRSLESLVDGMGNNLSLDSKDIYDQRKLYAKASVATSQSSEHHLEHLVTLPVSREDGVLSEDDAVRRVRSLEAQGRVWAQDLLLNVATDSLRLLDISSKDVFERFALGSVVGVRALPDPERRLPLLTLTTREAGDAHPDIHIFQCEKPDVICGEIEGAVSRFLSSKRCGSRERGAPSPTSSTSSTSSSAPPPSRALLDTLRLISKALRAGAARAFDGSDDEAVDVNIDSLVVNRIFGEIEAFVGRLQMAIDALHQLGQKRKRRLLSRKKAGDGLLKQRARFPPEDDFYEILQKFKYGFNLLGRLRNRVSDPTAEELVSILFDFLKLVLLHSRGPTGLAPSVVSPLLTRPALTLLSSCLSPAQTHVWENMGDAWTTSRDEWPYDKLVPHYHPVFRDGWIPPRSSTTSSVTSSPKPPPVAGSFMGLGRPRWVDEPAAAASSAAADDDDDSGGALPIQQGPTAPRKSAMKKSTSAKEPVVRTVTVRQNFAARNNEELFVSRGDELQVLDDSRKWWKVRDKGGREGFVPANVLNTGSHGGGSPTPAGGGVVTSISPASSADDVTAWLQHKGFSSTVVELVSGLDGRDILSLSRKEVIDICGPADGEALDRQLKGARVEK